MNAIQKIFVVSLIAKLALAASVPLFPDEAYYWVWSHHLQLSYFDHPPFVAWLFWLGQSLESFGSLVRVPAVLFGHFTGIFWFLALKKFLNPERLKWWALLFALQPLTGAGAILVTPDLPLMFFWALSFYLMVLLLETRKPRYALALGLSLGLGFCSKYMIVLFLPCAALWMLFERVSIRHWVLWTACLLPGLLLGSFPVWWWNLKHQWISFLFQMDHGLGRDPYELDWTLSYIAGEIGLIFPTLVWMIARNRPTWKSAGLWLMAFVPLLFFLCTSFKSRPEINWPIMAFPALIALATISAVRFRWALWTCWIWGVASLLLFSDVWFQWLPGNPTQMKTREGVIIAALSEQLKGVEPLFARTYQLAGGLSFALHRQVYKLKGMSRVDFYDFIPQSSPPPGTRFYMVGFVGENIPLEWQSRFTVTTRAPLDFQYELLEISPR